MAAKPPGGGGVGFCCVVIGVGKGHGVGVSIQSSMRSGCGLPDQNANVSCGRPLGVSMMLLHGKRVTLFSMLVSMWGKAHLGTFFTLGSTDAFSATSIDLHWFFHPTGPMSDPSGHITTPI